MGRRTKYSDPPVPSDKRCYVCARARPAPAIEAGDPFCSTECCRTYHAPLARRLGLLPKPRTLIDGDATGKLVMTPRELRWIAENIIARLPNRKAA
jgi:hypothetical protein